MAKLLEKNNEHSLKALQAFSRYFRKVLDKFLLLALKTFRVFLCRIDFYIIFIRFWTIRPAPQGFLFLIRLNVKMKSKEVTFLFFQISLGKNIGAHLR